MQQTTQNKQGNSKEGFKDNSISIYKTNKPKNIHTLAQNILSQTQTIMSNKASSKNDTIKDRYIIKHGDNNGNNTIYSNDTSDENINQNTEVNESKAVYQTNEATTVSNVGSNNILTTKTDLYNKLTAIADILDRSFDEVVYIFEERLAICEYEGSCAKEEAEIIALKQIFDSFIQLE